MDDSDSTRLTLTKPPFNLILGAATMTTPPPFDFSGVVMRNFPLKADFRALARFCDKYLNLATEFTYFRPAMPFVILSIVNYGKMSMEAGNLGWTSQNEVLFSISQEWYVRDERGRLVFKELAQVSPFIFVDDADSQVEGREVYGWPKVQGWFTPGVDPWTRHPLNRRELLSLSTNVFEKMFVGSRPVSREILACEEEAPPTFSVMPPQSDNILNPWVSLPKAITGWSDLLGTIAEMAATPALNLGQKTELRTIMEVVRGNPSTNNPTIADTWGRPLKMELEQWANLEDSDEFAGLRALHLEVLANRAPINQFSLKQFRDAEEPNNACYLALVRTPLVIERIFEIGEIEDATHIKIYSCPTLPIVDLLGLRVQSRLFEDEAKVDCLQPWRLFYVMAELRSGPAENVWSTDHYHHWEKREGSAAKGYFQMAPEAKTSVGTDMVRELDQQPGVDIANLIHERPSGSPLPGREARDIVLDQSVQPQMAVHAMLSNRWGDYYKILGGKLPTFVMRRDSVTIGAPSDFFVGGDQSPNSDPHSVTYWSPGQWHLAGSHPQVPESIEKPPPPEMPPTGKPAESAPANASSEKKPSTA
jgi:hypothetical protein